jgi:hypothetical protein
MWLSDQAWGYIGLSVLVLIMVWLWWRYSVPVRRCMRYCRYLSDTPTMTALDVRQYNQRLLSTIPVSVTHVDVVVAP